MKLLQEIAGKLAQAIGKNDNELVKELEKKLLPKLSSLFQLKMWDSTGNQFFGEPIIEGTGLKDWCEKKIEAGDYSESAFQTLFKVARFLDQFARNSDEISSGFTETLLTFMPDWFLISENETLHLQKPLFDFGKLDPAMGGRLSQFQKKYLKLYLHHQIERQGNIDGLHPSVLVQHGWALFLAQIFLLASGNSHTMLLDSIKKCRQKNLHLPPPLPAYLESIIFQSHDKPAPLTNEVVLDECLEMYRRNPLVITNRLDKSTQHECFGYSVPGLYKATQVNEDRYRAFRRPNATFLFVADGVSTADLGSGEQAADHIKTCFMRLQERFEALADSLTTIDQQQWFDTAKQLLFDFFQSSNDAVVDQLNVDFPLVLKKDDSTEDFSGKHAMCSTLIAAIVGYDQAIIANVGDSPAWLYSPKRKLFCQLTTDHNVGMEEDSLPHQSDLSAITRFIGAFTVGKEKQSRESMTLEPDIIQVQLLSGDYLLLGSDGLVDCIDKPTNEMKVNHLHDCLKDMDAKQEPLKIVVRKLISLGELGKSHDNMTLNAIHIFKEK